MSALLSRVAVFSARHRALVIGVWLVLLVGLGFASHAAGTKYSSSVTVSGSDSAAATDIMSRSFTKDMADSSPIVYHVDKGTLDHAVVDESVRALSRADNVATVSDLRYSEDGRTAYTTMVPSSALGDLSVEEAEAILDTAADAAQGVQVEAGGQLGDKITEPATETSELIGIAAAMLILVLVFGTITAMALPIVVAIVGLVCGLSIVSLLGHVLSVSDVAPTLATMIGLGPPRHLFRR